MPKRRPTPTPATQRRTAQHRDGAVLPKSVDEDINAWCAAIVQSADAAIVSTTLTGIITSWNAAASAATGYASAEIVGQPIFQLIPLDQHGALQHALELLQEGAPQISCETVWIGKDGQRVPVSLRIALLHNPAGQLMGAVLSTQDRLAPQPTEAVLRESQARLTGIIDSAMDAIITVDAAQRITLFNRAAERMFGCAGVLVLGQPLDHLIPKRYRAAHRAHIQAFGKTGITPRAMGGPLQPLVARRADGTEFPIEATISQVEIDGQKLYTAIIRDITERKRMEEQHQFLGEATTRLASSLDYMAKVRGLTRLLIPYLADYCLFYDMESSGQYHQIAVAHRNPAKEPLLRELAEHYHVDPSNPHSIVARVLQTQTAMMVPEASEAQVYTITQDPWLLATHQALRTTSYLLVPVLARDQVQGVLFLAMAESQRRYQVADLTLAEELGRRAAVALDNARLYQQAQEAVRVRDNFLSVAWHELKTPLTSLLGNAQLLQRRTAQAGRFPERDQRVIRVITDQAQRLNRLITALLDLSWVERGQLSLEQAPVDVAALARRGVDDIQLAHAQHPIVYQGPESPLMVIGDAVRLEQVVQNLISNAIKYSPQGGPITVVVIRRSDNVYISVSDRGIGIPAEDLPNLFGRFYRARNVEAQHISGMGIGLFVVKQIVTLHGGTVEVTSTEGEGSTFTISLPLAPRASSA